MILVDTSVWIEHFRGSESRLASVLTRQEVRIHPIIIGELATGNLKNRRQTLSDLQALPTVTEASSGECLELIESRKLHSLGLGWNDIHLLASSLLENIPLWTNDRRLHAAASTLGVASPFHPS